MINKTFEEAVLNVDNEKKEVREKEWELHKQRIDSRYKELQEQKKQLEVNNTLDLTSMSQQQLQKAREENLKYLRSAKNAKVFLNNDFKGMVTYFPGNIILIGAKSGKGKSTTSANLAFHELMQGGRPLVITNEESVGDIYNRVTCLCRKWSYVNHEDFTEEQLATFDEMMPKLASRMTVIDDGYNGSYGQTTTLEGMQGIIESLIKSKDQKPYTSVIFDYYQNINTSVEMPHLENWKVQEKFANYLDQRYKKYYPAPIVILAQLKEGKDLEFKEALEGRKAIFNRATCVIEMKAEPKLLRTGWKIHKSRFSESIGKTIFTGFDKGRFIEYTLEFKNKVEIRNQELEQKQLLKGIFNNDD